MIEKAGVALEKAQAEAIAQEKTENVANPEQYGNEKPDTVRPDKDTTIKQPVDTIEISTESKIAVSSDVANEVSVIEPKVYSSKGAVMPIKPEPQFSVKA